MNVNYLELVRPNVGQPLLLTVDDLDKFEITLAYRGNDFIPSGLSWAWALTILADHPISLISGSKSYLLQRTTQQISHYDLYEKYEPDIPDQKLPRHSLEYKYDAGYRWEVTFKVGLTATQKRELLGDSTGPKMLSLKFKNHINNNALYVDDKLLQDSQFTLIHLTDLHIAWRNDEIPEVLCRIKSPSEYEAIERDYVNFNENLRTVIKHANQKMRDGERVVMVITGDLMDYWYDGYVDKITYCGYLWNEGNEEKCKQVAESRGGYWNHSNMAAFRTILLGLDKRGEKPLFPVFTVLGNHDFNIHEPPLTFRINIAIGDELFPVKSKEDLNAYGLASHRLAAKAYDFYTMKANVEKVSGKWKYIHPPLQEQKQIADGHKDFTGDLPHYRACIVGRPDLSAMSYYHTLVNFDTDYRFSIGGHQFVLLNTGEDIYGQCELSEASLFTIIDRFKRYVKGHSRGFTDEHIALLSAALSDCVMGQGAVFVFSHGCFVGIDDELQKKISNNQLKESQSNQPFHVGKRSDSLSEGCGEGEFKQVFKLMTSQSAAGKPIIALSGHTHGIREIRLKDTSHRDEYEFFIDDYSDRDDIDNWSRWLRRNGPLFVTSGSCNRPEMDYREVTIQGNKITGIKMRQLGQPVQQPPVASIAGPVEIKLRQGLPRVATFTVHHTGLANPVTVNWDITPGLPRPTNPNGASKISYRFIDVQNAIYQLKVRVSDSSGKQAEASKRIKVKVDIIDPP